MIIRVGTGHVPERHVGVVNEVIRERLREVLSQDGLIACHLGRQFDSTGQKLLLVTVWRDMPALYRWVDGDLGDPAWPRCAARSIRVQLYESLIELADLTSGRAFDAETGTAGKPLTS